MTIQQSDFIKNGAITRTPDDAADEVFMVYEFDFVNAFTAASDTAEVGVLPAGAQLTDAYVIGTGLATLTAQVGLMAGTVGDAVSTRALGSELGAALNVASNETHIALGTCLAVAPDDTQDRSIGVQLSGDVAAGTDKIQIAIRYQLGH